MDKSKYQCCGKYIKKREEKECDVYTALQWYRYRSFVKGRPIEENTKQVLQFLGDRVKSVELVEWFIGEDDDKSTIHLDNHIIHPYDIILLNNTTNEVEITTEENFGDIVEDYYGYGYSMKEYEKLKSIVSDIVQQLEDEDREARLWE